MKKYLIALAVIVVIVVVGFIVYSQKSTEPTNQTISSETANWKTYKNDKYGFEFKYPSNFRIITDKVQFVYQGNPNGFNWYRLELADVSSLEKPFLRFEVDPDGYGPYFPDKIYKISENDGGQISFASSDVPKNENNDDGRTLIIIGPFMSQNKHYYSWHFSFEDGRIDYEPMLDKILSIFKFAK